MATASRLRLAFGAVPGASASPHLYPVSSAEQAEAAAHGVAGIPSRPAIVLGMLESSSDPVC